MAIAIPWIEFKIENFQLCPVVGEHFFLQQMYGVLGEAQFAQRERGLVVLIVERVFADHKQVRVARDHQSLKLALLSERQLFNVHQLLVIADLQILQFGQIVERVFIKSRETIRVEVERFDVGREFERWQILQLILAEVQSLQTQQIRVALPFDLVEFAVHQV